MALALPVEQEKLLNFLMKIISQRSRVESFSFSAPVRFSTKEIYEGLYETDFSEKDLLNKRLRISDLDLGNTSLKDFLHNDLQKVVDRKFMFIKALF